MGLSDFLILQDNTGTLTDNAGTTGGVFVTTWRIVVVRDYLWSIDLTSGGIGGKLWFRACGAAKSRRSTIPGHGFPMVGFFNLNTLKVII